MFDLLLFLPAIYDGVIVRLPFVTVTFLLGLPLGLWLSNLLHELAHMVAYLCLGIEFRHLRVSRFLLCKEGSRIRLRFDAKSTLFAAECACTYDKKLPLWKYCVALLSGGFLCAIVCPIAIYLSLPVSGALDALVLSFGVTSGMNAVVNLLYPHSSDRKILRKIFEDRKLP